MAYLTGADINVDVHDVFTEAENAPSQQTEIDVSIIEQELNEWKRTGVNIAFIGVSGSGKSTLINTLRGLSADDIGAAEVGTDEETRNVSDYPHPDNRNVVLWDVPGVGTDNFPRDTYLSKIKFEKYDFFIIVSNSRFTENDTWLVNNVREQMKRNQGSDKPGCFYFVRTKMDNEVNSMQRNHPRTNYTSEYIIEKMRANTLKKINSIGVEKAQLFLIDSLNSSKYDFSKLCSHLVRDAVGSKMEAIAYTMFTRSRETFDIKKQQLKTRMYKKALAVAFAEAFPVLGYDHKQMLRDEFEFYRKQFRVTDTDLNTFAANMNKDVDVLRKELKLSQAQCHVDEFQVRKEWIDTIVKMLTGGKFPTVTKTLSKFGQSVPIFYKHLCFLWDTLTKAYDDAIAVSEVYQRDLGQKAGLHVMQAKM